MLFSGCFTNIIKNNQVLPKKSYMFLMLFITRMDSFRKMRNRSYECIK